MMEDNYTSRDKRFPLQTIRHYIRRENLRSGHNRGPDTEQGRYTIQHTLSLPLTTIIFNNHK